VTTESPCGQGPAAGADERSVVSDRNEGRVDEPPSLLLVATVTSTLRIFLRPYAEHLRARGWRVDGAANGATTDAEIQGRFDVLHELPVSRSLRDVHGLIAGERALVEILEGGYDIVHVHTPIASFLTRWAAHRTPADRRPGVVYTAHGFHFFRGGSRLSNGLFLTAERVAGRWTDRLVVINDEDLEAARRHRIVPPSHLVRMRGIGVDTERYSPGCVPPIEVAAVRAGLGIDPSAPVIAAVAELSRNKRNADIVRALALLQRRDAVLVFAGAGRGQGELERLATELGVAGRVHFLGFIPDVRPLVMGSTALVLASHREGLNRSIMEALAMGVPVVASRARGNAELVDADSGFTFAVGDIPALVAHLDRLIDDPALREAMGRRGRERMVETYRLGRLLEDHDRMYDGLLGAVRARTRSAD
jgi:glycosyltransferase involved in cell wall biosynthesis